MKSYISKWMDIVALLSTGICLVLTPSTVYADLQILSSYQSIGGSYYYSENLITGYNDDGSPTYYNISETDSFSQTSTMPTKLWDSTPASHASSDIILKPYGFDVSIFCLGFINAWDSGAKVASATAELDIQFTVDNLSRWIFKRDAAKDAYPTNDFYLYDITPGMEKVNLLNSYIDLPSVPEGADLLLLPSHIYEIHLSAYDVAPVGTSANISVSQVPEPATMLLLVLCLIGLAEIRRILRIHIKSYY